MSRTRQIPTKVQDLRAGDTVTYKGTRHNVVRNIREWSGLYTLQLQVPGAPVETFRNSDPEFVFTRIGF